jgi:pimeloyl-ACP methyl ester carboxylesterase
VRRWVAMDAPLPGIGHWEDQLKNPKAWHFNFHGPDEERLVAGRERIYLDRFWNELSADPSRIDEATRVHYATIYARPGAIHSAFQTFAAFPQDAIDNQGLLARGKLPMPVLAIGGDHSYGMGLADELRFVATNVQGVSIANSGHWLMEEQPDATMKAITAFLEPSR